MPSIEQIQMLQRTVGYVCPQAPLIMKELPLMEISIKLAAIHPAHGGTGQKLTLTEVLARNPGLCIGTPPPTHKHLCGRIQSVSKTETKPCAVSGWLVGL